MSEPAEKKARMRVILGYWNSRGLAQPIRFLLKYCGMEFEDVLYGRPEESPEESWETMKFKLGLNFPNIPYLIDGDVKIVQSNAILRYIARKHDLCGKTESQKVAVDMLENVAMDFRNAFVRLCYNSDYPKLVDEYKENVKEKIRQFSDFLGQKTWFAGDEITYVDFVLYELLDQHRLFESSLLNGVDNLKSFLTRFEALPAIKEYMSSSEFMKWPVNGGGQWGDGPIN